jgi:hypothetical protein
VAGTPAAETCNGIDDDCDGTIDNGVTRPTTCGTGACAAAGIETCTAGVWGGDTCAPGLAGTEICNGIDDDCDGTVDNGIASIPTSCGVGACARTGSTTCIGGVAGDSCTPGTPAAAETCGNGIDDNCNGAIDDNCTTLGTCAQWAGEWDFTYNGVAQKVYITDVCDSVATCGSPYDCKAKGVRVSDNKPVMMAKTIYSAGTYAYYETYSPAGAGAPYDRLPARNFTGTYFDNITAPTEGYPAPAPALGSGLTEGTRIGDVPPGTCQDWMGKWTLTYD